MVSSPIWLPPLDECKPNDDKILQIIVGIALSFGQFLAFSPQVFNIVRKKHVEGINLLTYLLGTVSCTAVFLSGAMESYTTMFCCSKMSSWRCFVSLLSFMQVTINWMNYFIIFCLLAVYVKNTIQKPRAKLTFRLSLTVYVLWGLIGGIGITIAFLLIEGPPRMTGHMDYSKYTTIYNTVLGIIGTITIILQWTPQIITTFLHKGPGALSPITLSINAPGAIITALFHIAAGKTPAIWLPFVLSGSQQAVIVALILFFYCRQRGSKDPIDAIEEILETDPGFQGPALLLPEEDEEGDNDGLTYGRGNGNGMHGAGGPGSAMHRSLSDSESAIGWSESEEDEEEDTEDDDPNRALMNSASRRRKRRARKSTQPDTLSRSVPSYDTLHRDDTSDKKTLLSP